MLCVVRYLFVISTSVIDCLGRFVLEMTYYVSSGTLNLTKLKLTHSNLIFRYRPIFMTGSGSQEQHMSFVSGINILNIPIVNTFRRCFVYNKQ